MSVTNGERLVTKQDLADMYQGILPYLGGMPEVLANKFSKGDMYSTDEKMIGQWIDGKPLYQKVATDVTTESIDGKTDTSSVTKRAYKTITYSNAFSISLKSLQVKTNTSNNDGYLSIEKNGVEIFKANLITDEFTSISSIGIINCNANDTVVIYVGFNNSHSGCWFEVKGDCTTVNIPLSDTEMLMVDGFNVCRYTKTTDSAISIGDDTDYSTDEKIVGTWIDGSPIYQKTINTGMPSSEGVAHNISNLDKCVSMYGILLYTTDTYEPLPLIKSSSAYIRLQCTDTSVYVVQTGTFSNVEGSYVTIQYTKTTD